jgi:hypothetical protein
MATDRHGDIAGNTSALHITYGGAPEVVEEQPVKSRRFASFRPSLHVAADRFTVPVEHPGTIGPILLVVFPLIRKPLLHFAIDWQCARHLGFCLITV